ncbi:MAG: ribosome silencing factor [Candidatus Xenobium sp.]|jgi:ribosome-associated protein|nr:ribosome silencing factor [Burkholderiales bacterium]
MERKNRVETLELARRIADLCDEKMTNDVVVLDLQNVSILCDYFVLASAPTRIQTRKVARDIDEMLSAEGLQPKSIQGMPEGAWILMDYGVIVVHLFMDREREFYDLEGLWREAAVVYRPASQPAPDSME